MYKFLIQFIALFIPKKKNRRHFRKKWKLRLETKSKIKKLKDYGNYHPIKSFKTHKVKPKSVLVLEFNDFHGITLPAYIHYFFELGYHVDCLLRWGQNVEWQPLCRLPENWIAFVGDEYDLIKILNSEKIKEYEFVFINTTFYYGILSPYPNGKSVFNLVGNVPAGKYGTLMVEHNYEPYIKMFNEDVFIKAGNLFTCLGFRGTKMLSPSYVGDVTLTPKNKNKVCFLSIGTIHPDNKNFNLLIDACSSLVKEGIVNFEVQVIGAGNINTIPEELRPFFKILGPLSYKDMYDAIEKGDFLLNLIDPKNKDHHKYLDNWATGTCILFLSFAKIPLMHDFFVKSYFLDNENSIIYTSLAEGMKEAINMKHNEYLLKQKKLFQLKEKLEKKSLENLKDQIERMKNEFSTK